MKTFKKNCKKFVLIIGLIFLFASNYAQNNEQFFTGKGNMPVGAYYYPEHWPREQWGRDIKTMADLGFEFTHFAEFAWARLEPKEGKFDFEWLDWCVEEAAKNGLKVIMCTPSPCQTASVRHPTAIGFMPTSATRNIENTSNTSLPKWPNDTGTMSGFGDGKSTTNLTLAPFTTTLHLHRTISEVG